MFNLDATQQIDNHTALTTFLGKTAATTQSVWLFSFVAQLRRDHAAAQGRGILQRLLAPGRSGQFAPLEKPCLKLLLSSSAAAQQA
ncbi:hypothetical protein [Desulfovibrio desulfuricans]|uniref:hypothetical protein n=1 Tax=Desulfovibrio desulfuricans TaxID=876 RepID=UPI0035AE3740